jgi:hypothetical protein
MQPKLIVTFDRFSEADFQAKAGAIIASIEGNTNYPEPWIAPTPSLSQLKDALNAYQAAYHASLTRDTLKIAQRETARQTLTNLLKRLAPYLELIAQEDTQILATTGFDLRHDITKSTGIDILPAPDDFRVNHGQKSGTLEIHAARSPNAGSYDVQTTQSDPTVEANWQHAATSRTSSHIKLEGLTPAQTYWIRLRAIGSHGPGIWTDPICIIVI